MWEVHCIWLHLDCCTVPQALSHDQFMLSLSYVLLLLQSVCHIWARWEIWIVHPQMSLDRQCVICTMYGFIFSLSLLGIIFRCFLIWLLSSPSSVCLLFLVPIGVSIFWVSRHPFGNDQFQYMSLYLLTLVWTVRSDGLATTICLLCHALNHKKSWYIY